MKAIKINEFKAKGLRGFKNELVLPLSGKSTVIYGDNGSGKSSVADLIEWFYSNKIKHLSDNEVGRNGIDAMRNTALDDTEDGILSIKFKDAKFDCEKKLFIKKGSVNSEASNCSGEFNAYLQASANEKVLIRYKELSDFVVATPEQRLNQLSTIIGFSKVTETKKLLTRIYNRLDKEMKSSGAESIIQHSQRTLIKHLGQNVVSLKQFVDAVNELISSHGNELRMVDMEEAPILISKLKTPVDEKKLTLINFFDQFQSVLLSIRPAFRRLTTEFEDYSKKYLGLIEDSQNLNNLRLTDLLASGEKILSIQTDKIEECPLCLNTCDGKTLLEEVQKRLIALNDLKSKKQDLETISKDIKVRVNDELQKLRTIASNPVLKEDIYSELRGYVIGIGLDIRMITDNLDRADFSSPIEAKLSFNSLQNFVQLEKTITESVAKIKEVLPKSSNTDLIVKLQESYNAYKEILKQRELLNKVEIQRNTFEALCELFAKKQKAGLDLFFSQFSTNINEYYIFMNPDESVQNIKLIPIENEEEIKGLTIQYDFNDSAVFPPHKYLSESHLNCLGLSFFLASVEAFNKVNKFFILDDVISSFDANHRKRFLDLLAEKFNEYQIILLTHESQFFAYATSVAKTKGWSVDTLKFSKEKGTYKSEPKKSIYDRIIKKFEEGDDEKLGNDIRIYLEQFCKEIANCIEAKVNFRYNELNEDRMAPELINEIKSKIMKAGKGDERLIAAADTLLSRTLLSNFIGNKDSHDSLFVPSLGDCKAFWKDVLDIEKIFKCAECGILINRKFYTVDTKEIKCRCGKLKYSWQD